MVPAIGFFANPNLLDVAILANNHIMDHGVGGLVDTQHYLDQLPVSYVCILAFCHNEGPMATENTPGPCPLFTEEILVNRLSELKKENDLLILSYHGGEEFFTVPWSRRRKLFETFVQAGVDIVFGHHAHVVQGFEKLMGAMIIYGAGNFYMNTPYQLLNSGTELGAIFDVTYTPATSSFDLSHIPTYADNLSKRVVIASGHQKEKIESTISKSCKCLIDPELYSQEWNRQSFNRFRGRYGWISIVYRLCRFCLTKRALFKRDAAFTEKRDRDIVIGAVKYVFSKISC